MVSGIKVVAVPDRGIGLVNVVFVYRNKCSVCVKRAGKVREMQGVHEQLAVSKGP
jgi:hypothetical protein